MPRDLQITDNNTITLFDPIEKTEVVFTHRTPGTDERVRYMVGRYKRNGNKLIDRTRSALIDAAAEVLTGIRTGDFKVGRVILSSNPEEEGYREDWKELVKAAAGDLLFLMGHELFEGRVSIPDGQQLEIVSEFDASLQPSALSLQPAEGEAGGDIPPLPNSSGD